MRSRDLTPGVGKRRAAEEPPGPGEPAGRACRFTLAAVVRHVHPVRHPLVVFISSHSSVARQGQAQPAPASCDADERDLSRPAIKASSRVPKSISQYSNFRHEYTINKINLQQFPKLTPKLPACSKHAVSQSVISRSFNRIIDRFRQVGRRCHGSMVGNSPL